MLVTPDLRPAIHLLAAEKPKRADVVPSITGHNRTLRYLWLTRLTASEEVFQQVSKPIIQGFRDNPFPSYSNFPDHLEEALTQAIPINLPDYINLPTSAGQLAIRHRTGRTRIIPSFTSQLQKKIAADRPVIFGPFAEMYRRSVPVEEAHRDELFTLMKGVALEDAVTFKDGALAYSMVDSDLLELIDQSISKIKKLPPIHDTKPNPVRRAINFLGNLVTAREVRHEEAEVYYGRDARWLYLARKAEMLGLDQLSKLNYLVASRVLLDSPYFAGYVQDKHIPFDAYHIDIAAGIGQGRGIRRVLALINPQDRELTEQEFLARARFVSAPHLPRTVQLFPETDSSNFHYKVGEVVERRIVGQAPLIMRKFSNGQIEPEFNPGEGYCLFPYSQEIKNWAMDQAVIRHFLPKAS